MLRQFVLNNLALVLQYAVGSLVPLLLVPHIVRELGLAQFGSLAIALAWASYGAVTVQYTFHLSGPHQLAQLTAGETPLDVVCRIGSAKLVLLAGVLLTFGFGTLAAAGLGHRIATPQAWLLLAMPLAAALHTGWHLQAAGRFGTVSALSMVGAVLALLLGLMGVAAEVPGALATAALALSLGPLWAGGSTLVASTRLLVRAYGNTGHRAVWRSPWAELRGGWPLFASQFTAALYTASGPIVVGVLVGVEEAGAYGAVERVSTAVAGGCMLIHTAAYPKLAQLYASDRSGYIRLMRIVLGAYVTVTTVVVLSAVVVWQPLLHFVLGAQGASHGPLLAVALVWVLLGIFGTALTGYLAVRGEGHRVLPLTAKVLTLSLLLGVPGVLAWGASAWMAAHSSGSVLAMVCLSENMGAFS